ncbi:YkvA family protein [Rhizobium panacihumi]|uniref:YkvA family protein n=1 Tax=Rhizobium panacihumi TaxID=2008450 RepID=UPI003D78C647
MGFLERTKIWAKRLKREVMALWLAARDTRVPLMAKLVAGSVAAYALSPVDLIPDFIPILGYLDDLLVVPLGIMLAVRLVPPPLMAEFREQAALRETRPTSRTGFVAVLAIWLLCLIFLVWGFRNFV